MNAQKFTQKSMEILQDAQNLSVERSNTQVEQLHLLLALLTQQDGLIPQLMDKMGMDKASLTARAENQVDALPRATGGGRESGKIYISQQLEQALVQAEREADRMKDEYVSVEHIMLAVINKPSRQVQEVLRRFGIDGNKFLSALSTVRGNTRVTSDSPEETYDALSKYGQDLVALAKNHKLDPVDRPGF